ncbi:thiopeptide-type bacteriocin biosynthesis protein [Nocardiopsis sp. NPDC006139]|uniref:thiopeptide-type bacteriocin biosynthesis protein n=1 Tax=Nocardiopsis sp. NPDC006139 TaxID=3154578 RepID=UPI0033A2F1B3
MKTDPTRTGAWLQVNVEFPDPATAEHAGVHHLALALADFRWFVMRKGAWRCRIHLPHEATEQMILQERVAELLDGLTAGGHLSRWTHVVYEPEPRAFGGTAAMEAAHTLFCADTRHLMEFLATAEKGPDRRKEVSLLLCHTLMRSAGLDHYEQGDVWDRVSATRHLPTTSQPTEKVHHQVHRLLSVDPGPHAPHFTTGAFAGFAPWAQAFQDCGRELADLHTRGRLERGLRAVLAHHVIFCWNRLGIPAPAQAVLSHTAARTIFDPETVHL